MVLLGAARHNLAAKLHKNNNKIEFKIKLCSVATAADSFRVVIVAAIGVLLPFLAPCAVCDITAVKECPS